MAQGSPAGCFFVCIVPSTADEHARKFFAGVMAATEKAIAERLSDGIARGELPPDFPVARRARRVMDLGMSMSLRARVGTSRRQLMTDAADAAAVVFEGA